MKTIRSLIVIAVAAACFAMLLLLGHGADRLAVDGARFDRQEIQLNEFTASAQSHVALDMDGDGNVVTAWDSRRQSRRPGQGGRIVVN